MANSRSKSKASTNPGARKKTAKTAAKKKTESELKADELDTVMGGVARSDTVTAGQRTS